jgi:hypothetical protein
LLFKYLREASGDRQEKRIDHHKYQDADLVEIKIKLNLPYMTSSSDYEKLVGEIKIKGSHYSYVKRKVSQDTLFLLCLPDQQKDRLQSSEDGYAGIAQDFDKSGTDNKSAKKAPIYNQFHQPAAEYRFAAAVHENEKYNRFVNELFPQFSPLDNGHPPEVLAEI